MKKKTALVMISLLTLTALLTTPYFVPSAVAPDGQSYHWRIDLAQKKADVLAFWGNLVNEGGIPISEEFYMRCNQTYVFWKVNTSEIPFGIHFWLSIDWNKDGFEDDLQEHWEILEPPVEEYDHEWLQFVKRQDLVIQSQVPLPFPITEPICTYWDEIQMIQRVLINGHEVSTTDMTAPRLYHLSSWEDQGLPCGELSHCDQIDINQTDPPVPPPESPISWWHVEDVIPEVNPVLLLDRMVVVEVHQTEISHQWQLTIKTENARALWKGFLTDINQNPIEGANFTIISNCTRMQCVVVRTPNCTIPHDILWTLLVFSKDDPDMLTPIYEEYDTHDWITQFPWTKVRTGIDPTGITWRIELELTEVQMHRYYWMGITTMASQHLAGFPPTFNMTCKIRPMYWHLDITFTPKDPITGIVKLGIPAQSFVGQNYTWFDLPTYQWFRWQTWTAEQGYGWLFTGEGKNPILGDVDIYTFNNDTGVYWLSPSPKAGELAAPTGQPPSPGPDGIPGTCDDGFGNCTADPPGSSVTIIPATLTVETSFDNATWSPLFEVPWPLIFTTATAYDIVNEPTSVLNGVDYEVDGEPWEFLAGIDHKAEGWNVTWKHPKCNAYVIHACAWSVLNTTSEMGIVDAIYYTKAKLVREDCIIADVNCDEKVNIKDIGVCGKAFGAEEQFYPPPNWDKPFPDPHWDPHGDLIKPRGKVNIKDIGRIGKDFGAKLTPDCIIRK